MTLDTAKPNTKYKIANCTLSDEPVRLRFFEMGMVEKAVVSVVKTAPLGDPLEIEVLGYRLCLRKNEARHFVVVEAR